MHTLLGKPDLIINELESYLLEPRAQENQNILIWWKEREKIFPKLSTMARDLLCIQASSVSIERQFSKAALVLTKKRNRLNPKPLKSLLCLHSFYNIILSSHLFILFLDDVRKKKWTPLFSRLLTRFLEIFELILSCLGLDIFDLVLILILSITVLSWSCLAFKTRPRQDSWKSWILCNTN